LGCYAVLLRLSTSDLASTLALPSVARFAIRTAVARDFPSPACLKRQDIKERADAIVNPVAG